MSTRPTSAVPHRPSTAGAAPSIKGTSQTQHGSGDTVGELKDLARLVRQKEIEQQEWKEQVQKEFRRQSLEIEALRRENEPLQAEVNSLRATEATSSGGGGGGSSGAMVGSLRPGSAAFSSAGRRPGTGDHAALRRAKNIDAKRENLINLEQKIRNQRDKNEEIQNEIEGVRGRIHAARRSMGGVNVVQDSHRAVQQQIKILENRLDQSLQRFNQVLGENKSLRDEIDTLRAERDVFDLIYLKLEAELQEKKKEMAFIIEVSNIAYEERDNNVQVLQNLKQFAQEEMGSFNETFKELDALVEEDRKMRDQVRQRLIILEKKEKAYNSNKDNNNNNEDVFDEYGNLISSGNNKGKSPRQQGKGGNNNSSMNGTNNNNNTNNNLGSPSSMLSASHRSGGGGADETEAQKLARYEEVFESIRTATDSPDLERVVHKFLHAEEDNFSLFAFVNDLGREVEQLEKSRAQLLQDMDQVTGGSDADRERRQTLQQLEDKLRAEEIAKDRLTEHIHRIEGILRSVMLSVEQIFTKLDGDDAVVIQEHGVAGITFESLLLYLAAVESRADELLNAWSKNSGITVDPSHGMLRGPQAPYDAVHSMVDPKRLPSTGEDVDTLGGEDDSKPLTREELLKKAQRRLQTQQNLAAQSAAGKSRKNRR